MLSKSALEEAQRVRKASRQLASQNGKLTFRTDCSGKLSLTAKQNVLERVMPRLRPQNPLLVLPESLPPAKLSSILQALGMHYQLLDSPHPRYAVSASGPEGP